MKNAIAIIPAAGKGSRLGLPFSKELLPLFFDEGYFPVINASIKAIKSVGVSEVVVVINHSKSDIIKYLGNGNRFGLKIKYAVQEESKSLPHAIFEALRIEGARDVFFLMPDTLITPGSFLEYFYGKISINHSANIGVFKSNRPDKFAMVKFDNKLEVISIEEKNPHSKFEYMWGFWHWNNEVSKKFLEYDFNQFKQDELTLSDVMLSILEPSEIFCIKMSNYLYRDLGTFDEINDYIKNSLGE